DLEPHVHVPDISSMYGLGDVSGLWRKMLIILSHSPMTSSSTPSLAALKASTWISRSASASLSRAERTLPMQHILAEVVMIDMLLDEVSPNADTCSLRSVANRVKH
ncbi:unnamed protein product, partial [Mycena citricolor]